MAVEELATAYVQVVPSALGIESSIAKQFAPASGIAQAEGAKAGQAFGGRFGDTFKKLLPTSFQGISLGPLFGGAIAAGLLVGLVEIGGAVGKMRRIIAQEGGATGDQLTKLFDTAKREATQVPAKFDDIAKAVSELERRGVPLGSMFDKLAKQELYLAKITGTDVATNVEATTGLFAKFNVPLRDQSRELDVLFKAQQKSGKGLQDLIDPLVKGGTNLQQFGFDLDHSIALVAGLAAAGVQVQPVLSSLRKAFGSIAKEGKDPQTVLRGIIKELTDGKHPAQAMADAIKLFGNRGGAELARAIQQGKLSVDALLKSITNGKDGIVATGEATLTLSDRIQLLKNRAAIALAPLGSQIRSVFSDIVTQASPAFAALFGGIANAASGLLPVLIPIGIAATGLFKGALPVMQLFADDLNTIGDALHAVPAPVLAGAAALGILTLAALGAADGLIAAGRAAIASSLEFAATPFGAAILVFAGLVTAISLFRREASPAQKEAKDLGKALFDASSDAGFFASGITDATSGVRAFLEARIKAGKDDTLNKVLLASGQNVTTLSSHLTDGTREWARYRNSVALAAIAGINFDGDVVARNQQLDGTRALLDQQRTAYAETAKQQLKVVVSTGELTQRQVDGIVATSRSADGTVNWGKALDATNAKLGTLKQQTERSAQAVADSSPVYSALVDQFASGVISADQFSTVLKEQFKFSAEQAKAAAKTLGDQVKTLASEVDKSFPQVSDAAKGLKVVVVGVANDLAARQDTFARQIKESSTKSGAASKQLADDMSTNLRHIRDDFKTLADDADPQRFTENLFKQVQNISTFFANIKTLVAAGFPQLARQMLQLGPQVGGNLAAGFAAQPTKAKVANAALGVLGSTKDQMKAWVLAHFGELQGIGTNFDAGLAAGVTAGTGTVTGAVSSMADSVKRHTKGQFRVGSPSLWARDVIGKNIMLGLADGLDPKPILPAVTKMSTTIKQLVSSVTSSSPTSGPLFDFINTAIGALPTIANQISAFSSNFSSALSTETQALIDYHRIFQGYAADRARIPGLLAKEANATKLLHALQVKLFNDTAAHQAKTVLDADARLVANAQKAVDDAKKRLADTRSKIGTDRSDVANATKTLRDAQAALAEASNVGRFNAGLRSSNASVIQFQGSLSKLIRQGLTGLARNLAEQGPDAAGALARFLSRNTKAAREAERNINRAKQVDANFRKFLEKNFKGLGSAALETGTSVGKDLLAGITDFLKAGGKADVVSAQIRKIINPAAAKKAGTAAGKAAAGGLAAELAGLKIGSTARPVGGASKLQAQLSAARRVALAHPGVVIAPVKATPVPSRSISQTIHDALATSVATSKPHKLQIELTSKEGAFDPVRVEVDLAGRRVTRMRAAVKAKVQALG